MLGLLLLVFAGLGGLCVAIGGVTVSIKETATDRKKAARRAAASKAWDDECARRRAIHTGIADDAVATIARLAAGAR